LKNIVNSNLPQKINLLFSFLETALKSEILSQNEIDTGFVDLCVLISNFFIKY